MRKNIGMHNSVISILTPLWCFIFILYFSIKAAVIEIQISENPSAIKVLLKSKAGQRSHYI